MTADEIIKEVERINRMAGDDEAAHSTEDTLHQSVLQAIADGTAENPQACAEAALRTLEIAFARWCA